MLVSFFSITNSTGCSDFTIVLQVILYANAVPRRIMQSQSVMLNLRQADVVWLRQAKGLRFAVYGNQDMQITFNGYLVYPEG